MEKGIKEIKEMLAAVEVVALAAKKVMKDGKVDFSDAMVIVELGSQLPILLAAIEGMGEVVAEAQDIQADEAVALVGEMYAIAKKVQEA